MRLFRIVRYSSCAGDFSEGCQHSIKEAPMRLCSNVLLFVLFPFPMMIYWQEVGMISLLLNQNLLASQMPLVDSRTTSRAKIEPPFPFTFKMSCYCSTPQLSSML